MKKYIINLMRDPFIPSDDSTLQIINPHRYEVDKINFNILSFGIEFNIDIEGKNRKFIIPWQQVMSIEEINT